MTLHLLLQGTLYNVATGLFQAAVHLCVQLLAPWQSLYSDSKVVAGTVGFVHIAGLLFGGGFAVATDRAVLQLRRATAVRRQYALEEIHRIHRPVLIGLTALVLSGVALAAADVQTYAESPVFWVKMFLVALLGVNGLVLMRTERALRAQTGDGTDTVARMFDSVTADTVAPLWRRLRTTAYVSIALWSMTMLAGTILVNSA